MDEHYEYRNYSIDAASLHTTKMNIDEALKFIYKVNPSSCRNFHPQDLILHGDISYGAKDFFENEAKMALRLANFISAFLQVSDPNEVYSGKRVADKPLTEDQMIAETLALVMGMYFKHVQKNINSRWRDIKHVFHNLKYRKFCFRIHQNE